MRVKIAELDEISCGADAAAKLQQWLKKYAESSGQPDQTLVIPAVDVVREESGWYAVMPGPAEVHTP